MHRPGRICCALMSCLCAQGHMCTCVHTHLCARCLLLCCPVCVYFPQGRRNACGSMFCCMHTSVYLCEHMCLCACPRRYMCCRLCEFSVPHRVCVCGAYAWCTCALVYRLLCTCVYMVYTQINSNPIFWLLECMVLLPSSRPLRGLPRLRLSPAIYLLIQLKGHTSCYFLSQWPIIFLQCTYGCLLWYIYLCVNLSALRLHEGREYLFVTLLSSVRSVVSGV